MLLISRLLLFRNHQIDHDDQSDHKQQTCYQAHTEQVLATIARLQPGMAHQGRRPQLSAVERQAKLSALQTLLADAVKEEDYETAAALRDQITALEAGLSSPSA